MAIAYILGIFPSYSEYFILNEIIELRKRDFRILILSISKGPALDIGEPALFDDVIYSPKLFSPAMWLAHLYVFGLLEMRYVQVLKEAVAHRQFSLVKLGKGLKNFSRAVYFIYRLRKKDIRQLHAHFLSLPASIALLMSKLCGIDFSCSAHAHDIFTTPKEELANKIQVAKFVVTCTQYNALYLKDMVSAKEQVKIHQVYHGIGLNKWPRKPIGSNTPDCYLLQVLTVGRLVEKKGLIFLLQAIKKLQNQGAHVQCAIVGDGPLFGQLQAYIHEHGLNGIVRLHGALPQKDIALFYQQADVFVLPCIETANGDKDGLPNVLMEALAIGIPVITTAVSAVPELIQHEVTGLLVPQKDADGIAQAIWRLKNDKTLCQSIVMKGWERVQAFDIQNSTDQLCQLFEEQ